MEYLALIPMFIVLFILILCVIALIKSADREQMTDYELYGMDAEEYLKEQVGEEYYNTVNNTWMRWNGVNWLGVAFTTSTSPSTSMRHI